MTDMIRDKMALGQEMDLLGRRLGQLVEIYVSETPVSFIRMPRKLVEQVRGSARPGEGRWDEDSAQLAQTDTGEPSLTYYAWRVDHHGNHYDRHEAPVSPLEHPEVWRDVYWHVAELVSKRLGEGVERHRKRRQTEERIRTYIEECGPEAVRKMVDAYGDGP